MTVTLTLRVTFESDLHLGAGHGLGELIDNALLRDPDGVIRLNASELMGTLRESLFLLLQPDPLTGDDPLAHLRRCRQGSLYARAESLRRYCPPDAPDRCPLCRVFGTPEDSPSPWRARAARPLVAEAGDVWQPGRDAALAVSRTAVDPLLRRGEDQRLFTSEYGDAGLSFLVRWETDNPRPAALGEAAAIFAAARATGYLGAHKSRGVGRCRIELEDLAVDGQRQPAVTPDRLIQWFEQHWVTPREPDQSATVSREKERTTPTVAATTAVAVPAPVEGLRRVRLDLHTLEPLLIARQPQVGNEYTTVTHIPGSTLWGLLIARIAVRRPDALDRALAGGLRVTPAYPALVQGEGGAPLATIPTPLDMLGCKTVERWIPAGAGELQHGVNRASAQISLEPYCAACLQHNGTEVALKPPGGYLPVQGGRGVTIVRSSELHLGMSLERGAGHEGDLFGYTVIGRGTAFAAEIEGPESIVDAALAALGTAINGRYLLTIGKRTKAGHGACEVTASALEPNAPPLFCPSPLPERLDSELLADLAPVTVTLLTPLIERDSWGRARTGLDAAWLAEVLGLEPARLSDHFELLPQQFSGSDIIYGFNQRAGLPRWADIAVREGSAISFVWWGEADDLLQRIAAAESRRHGLRTNEGFGMAAFNHPVYSGADDGRREHGSSKAPAGVRDGWYWRHESELLSPVLERLRDNLTLLFRDLKESERAAVARTLFQAAGDLTLTPALLRTTYLDPLFPSTENRNSFPLPGGLEMRKRKQPDTAHAAVEQFAPRLQSRIEEARAIGGVRAVRALLLAAAEAYQPAADGGRP